MKLNSTNFLEEERGDYVLFGHFSCEGWGVLAQYKTLEEAIKGFGQDSSCNKALLKLVDIDIKEN